MYDTLRQHYRDHFQGEPDLCLRAPGRINLIGEHTDYNEGFVLPAAIDKSVYFAVGARTDNRCHFFALDLSAHFSADLQALQRSDTHPWANYLMGVLQQLQETYPEVAAKMQGINLVFAADLPSGAGLSSSAAIENGVGFAVNELFGLGLSRMQLLQISRQAENRFVGMNCGIMDMFVSMMGQENQFLKIDCRDLSFEYIPFEAPDMRLVLCDTTVKHALVDSEYNTRRAECEEGVDLLRAFDPTIRHLREVSLSQLELHRADLRPVVYRRCQYVIEEIARVEAACRALQNQDFAELGRLMYATHEGLSGLYEVSCPELDFLVAFARERAGVLGARMMGGGFGGCTLNLLYAADVEGFILQAKIAFQARFGKDMPCYVVRPGGGVGLPIET